MNAINTKFDTEALRARILDQYGTIRTAAAAFGMNPKTLGRKLNRKADFNYQEIYSVKDAMKLSKYEVDRYFFTEEDYDLKVNIKALMKLVDGLRDDQIQILIDIANLIKGRPDRREYAAQWTGKPADLPAALAQI